MLFCKTFAQSLVDLRKERSSNNIFLLFVWHDHVSLNVLVIKILYDGGIYRGWGILIQVYHLLLKVTLRGNFINEFLFHRIDQILIQMLERVLSLSRVPFFIGQLRGGGNL